MNMVRIAAVQMKVTKSSEENTKRMLSWIKKAKAKRAKIICFPEISVISDHKNIASVDPHLDRIRSACKQNRIFCIFSSYTRENENNYNVAYLIDDKGHIIYKYRKTKLWGKERKYIKAGKTNKILKTKLGNIGVIVCYDFAFPQHVAKLRDADIIFCPSFMIDYQGARDVIRSFPVMRAFENMSYFVMCDAYNKRTARMSCITSPFRIIKRLEGKEGMIFADININRIRKLKKKFRRL